VYDSNRLGPMGNGTIQVMMGSGERIEEGQRPEAQEG
jgi:hypothetical protein